LPQEFRDPNRKLAWANAICSLFLLVGIAGLKAPRISGQSPAKTTELLPVLLVPEEHPQKPQELKTPDTLETIAEVPIDQPVVATVVAVNANAVAFSVPVAGPVILSPARLAAAGPATNRVAASPKSTPYIPSEADWGGHKLEYPPLATRRGYQGRVVLDIVVTPSGEVSSVMVHESSGYQILDDAAVEHVRKYLHLRNPPGETRLHTLDMLFQLKP